LSQLFKSGGCVLDVIEIYIQSASIWQQ